MSESSQTILSLEGLGMFWENRFILSDIDLSFYSGEMIYLGGPNGAGKSSLLSVLSSPKALYNGRALYFGKDLKNSKIRRIFLQQCSYLGHEPGLFYSLSVAKNLEFFLKSFSQKVSPEDTDRMNYLLEQLNLLSCKKQKARSLSKGQKQRLGIARAFLVPSQVLLLDEPLTSLDYHGSQIFRKLLLESKRKGAFALITGHDSSFYEGLAERFIFLSEGNLVADIKAERYTHNAKKKIDQLLYSFGS